MSGEDFKGGIHLVAFAICVTMALYNALRLTEEPDPKSRRRLKRNVAVYTLGSVYEVPQIRHHWRQG